MVAICLSHKAKELLEKAEREVEELIEKRWGILDFREIFFKPYRIIYEIRGKTVFIHAVLDERRNCEDLLQQRLLGA